MDVYFLKQLTQNFITSHLNSLYISIKKKEKKEDNMGLIVNDLTLYDHSRSKPTIPILKQIKHTRNIRKKQNKNKISVINRNFN